jgi:hypothetical protein
MINLVRLFFQMAPSESCTSNGSEVRRKKSEEILTKDRLIEIIRGLLQTNVDLAFLLKMDQSELETLAASIRDRVDKISK